MKIDCKFNLRLVITLMFYLILVLCSAILTFAVISKNGRKAPPSKTTETSMTSSPHFSTSTVIVSTTMSVNAMLCEGYLCAYDNFQVPVEVTSYEECEETCSVDKDCNFVTFTSFRRDPKCYLLFKCIVLLDPCESLSICQSGPKTC